MSRGAIISMMTSGAGGRRDIKLRQFKIYTSPLVDNNHYIQFDSTPISGNFLVMCIVSDAGVSSKTKGTWNTVSSVDFADTSINYKVSDGTEDQIKIGISAVTNCLIVVLEYENLQFRSGDGQFNSGGLGPTSLVMGPCNKNQLDIHYLIFALGGLSNGGATPPTITAWSGGFVSAYNVANSGAGPAIGMGIGIWDVIGDFSAQANTTATLSAAGSSNNVGIMVSFSIL